MKQSKRQRRYKRMKAAKWVVEWITNNPSPIDPQLKEIGDTMRSAIQGFNAAMIAWAQTLPPGFIQEVIATKHRTKAEAHRARRDARRGGR